MTNDFGILELEGVTSEAVRRRREAGATSRERKVSTRRTRYFSLGPPVSGFGKSLSRMFNACEVL